MKKKGLLVLLVVLVFVLGGCDVEMSIHSPEHTKAPSEIVNSDKDNKAENSVPDNEDNSRQEDSNILNLEQATEISVNWNAGETSTLLKEKFVVEKSGEATQKYISYDNTVIGYNGTYGFYYRGYMEDMAQDYSRYEIYSYHLESGESTLLYETTAGRISEARVSGNYLYWVETKGIAYQVVQHAVDTKEQNCIVEYSEGVMSPCLEVSEGYVIWDEDYGDGLVRLAVWDIEKQELKTIEELSADGNMPATKFMPWSRYKIVDDYITFFTQDEKENVYINRYQLQNAQIDTIAIGDKANYKKLAGCFSNEKYIGWFTEYSVGTFYFYEVETGKLLKWVLEDSNSIFSFALYDKLYVNKGSKVYVYDIDSKSTLKCNVEGQALQFRYNEGEVWIDVTGKDKAGIWVVGY